MLLQQSNLRKQRNTFLTSFFFIYYPNPLKDKRFNLGCSKKGTSSSNSEILKELWKTISKTG